MLAASFLFSFSCYENFRDAEQIFFFSYLTVKALYFFSMAYKLKKGLESNYINRIQLVNYLDLSFYVL